MNIVLAHGILGFSHLDIPLAPQDYFAGIAAFLRIRFGANVIAPAVDPTAGIEIRAEMLGNAIRDALDAQELRVSEPIHIIAHSMGGLDARRLITRTPAIQAKAGASEIRTLATIGTPHRGSPIADLVALKFLDHIPLLSSTVKDADVALGKLLAHFRISLDGLHDLTSEAAQHFNAANPDRPTVRYLSVAGRGRDGGVPTSGFFLPYYLFIQAHSLGREQSDGVVTVSSAKWGDFDPNLWPADHADEIGHDLDRPLGKPDPETFQRYEQVVLRF
jgi:triacylglycerol lipase